MIENIDPSKFSGSVPEKYKPWVDAVVGDPLPRIGLAPLEKPGHVSDYALPDGIEAAKALIKDPKTWEAVQ